MYDEQINETNKTIEAVTHLAKVIPVYQDIVQPSAKEVGKNLLVVTKVVSVALAPLKALVWGYEQVEKYLTEKISEKLESVPEDKIITPDPKIVGPAVEALRYTGTDTDVDLRDMYASLIANAMNVDKLNIVHPAYVDIIKNLSSDEALILKVFLRKDSFPYMNIKIKIPTGGTVPIKPFFSNIGQKAGLPKERIENTPKYLTNLIRLGILDSPTGRYLVEEKYYTELMTLINFSPEKEKDIEYEKRYVEVTPFGHDFIKTVVE